jgi:hypothetical protein
MTFFHFQTHSCEHCQRMVIDVSHFQKSDRDQDDMANTGALFDLNFEDILSGATAGCMMCAWILDDECVSREAVVGQVTNNLAEGEPF